MEKTTLTSRFDSAWCLEHDDEKTCIYHVQHCETSKLEMAAPLRASFFTTKSFKHLSLFQQQFSSQRKQELHEAVYIESVVPGILNRKTSFSSSL